MDSPSLAVRLGAEAVGTFMFFFLGFSSLATLTDIGPGAIGNLGIAFSFGLGLALAVATFGHISGGHFNPAVTFGLMVVRKHPVKEVVPYWVAQIIGGILAAVVTMVVFSEEALNALDTNPGVTAAGGAISDWGALVLEIIATGVLLMVILTVATDKRAPWNGVLAPLMIGLVIFTAASAVGPSSGGSFNPARSLTPLLISFDNWSNIWIYLVGPLAGAVLGASIWSLLLEKDEPAAA
jgi:MIP family channel proteins